MSIIYASLAALPLWKLDSGSPSRIGSVEKGNWRKSTPTATYSMTIRS